MSLVGQNNAYRIVGIAISCLYLISINSLATKTYIAVKHELPIGVLIGVYFFVQDTLKDYRIEFLLIILFESFHECRDLLPWGTLLVANPHNSFLAIGCGIVDQGIWES